jgi:hypothetical protein
MVEIGVFENNSFVAFGPRKELSFMKVAIYTYYKYNMLMVMIVMHTFITDFIADSLSPHVLNVVQDTKSKYIPHKPLTYFAITTIWAIYCSISQLFAIFIAFAQIDLLIVRMCSDIVANLVTTSLYLQAKVHDPVKFKRQETESKPPIQKPCSHCCRCGDGAEMVVHDSNVTPVLDTELMDHGSLSLEVVSDTTSLLHNKYEVPIASTSDNADNNNNNNNCDGAGCR